MYLTPVATRSAVVGKTEMYNAVTNRCLNGRSQREEHRVMSVIVELTAAGKDGQVMVAMVTPSDIVIDIIDEITQDAEPYVKEGVMDAGDWELEIEGQAVSRCKTMRQLKVKDLTYMTIRVKAAAG